MSDTLQPATAARPHQPIHDARAVHDIANLRFENVMKNAHACVVLKLHPAPLSGSATIIGAAIDASTGKMVELATRAELRPETARSGMIKDGSWELVASLTGPDIADRGKYSWTEPMASFHKLESTELYRPFAEGGCILCRYLPNALGSAQFDAVHLLPPGWENDVKPAYKTYKQDAQVFLAPSSSAQFEKLHSMLNTENSVLATMGFRTLLEKGKMDLGLLRKTLAASQGYRLAVFVYLVMRLSADSALINEVDTLIGEHDALERHKSIALGTATARLLHPEWHSTQLAAPRLMSSLHRRTKARSGDVGGDAYLNELLQVAGNDINATTDKK